MKWRTRWLPSESDDKMTNHVAGWIKIYPTANIQLPNEQLKNLKKNVGNRFL